MRTQPHRRLDLSVILEPLPTARDTITGVLPGGEKLEIVVARRWQGWTPLLRVTVAGHVIYSGRASESDQREFDALNRRANASRFGDDEAINRITQAAEAAKLWRTDPI